MNSNIAIRAATRVAEYLVTCDSCHGKRYTDGVLCERCEGNGKLLIREPRLKTPITENGKLAVILLAAIGFGVVMVLAILM